MDPRGSRSEHKIDAHCEELHAREKSVLQLPCDSNVPHCVNNLVTFHSKVPHLSHEFRGSCKAIDPRHEDEYSLRRKRDCRYYSHSR